MAAYGELCRQFYDADKGFAGEEEVAWYAQRLPRDAGPVLEAMCGSGRLLVPLLREGFHALKAVWEKHFAPRHAINRGHNGYRTENILWNLLNGELDFVESPKVFMILTSRAVARE